MSACCAHGIARGGTIRSTMTQYHEFSDHRLRTALDLMDRVPLADPRRVYDLGCGSGHVTRMLADRWPDATVVGIDISPQMLAQARETPSRVQWEQGDLAEWRPDASPSLLFSNAVIQWLPDHGHLIPRLFSLLPPGGCLAVQAPLSWDLPSHRIMRETLADGGENGTALGDPELRRDAEIDWMRDADVYYDLLAPDASLVDVWTTEYLQALTGEDPVLELRLANQPGHDVVTATSMGPILEKLAVAGQKEPFLDEYRERLRRAYRRRRDGVTLYPVRRLFFVAVRR